MYPSEENAIEHVIAVTIITINLFFNRMTAVSNENIQINVDTKHQHDQQIHKLQGQVGLAFKCTILQCWNLTTQQQHRPSAQLQSEDNSRTGSITTRFYIYLQEIRACIDQ